MAAKTVLIIGGGAVGVELAGQFASTMNCWIFEPLHEDHMHNHSHFIDMIRHIKYGYLRLPMCPDLVLGRRSSYGQHSTICIMLLRRLE